MMKQFNYDLIDEINVNPEENYFFEEIKPFMFVTLQVKMKNLLAKLS